MVHQGNRISKWFRFDNYDYSKSMELSTDKWDGVVFKPKHDIIFYGFGIFGSSDGSDLKLKVQWIVDRKKSPEINLQLQNKDIDKHNPWHEFHISKYGFEP